MTASDDGGILCHILKTSMGGGVAGDRGVTVGGGRWVMPKYLSTCTHSGAKAGSRIQLGITGQALGQHHHCHKAALWIDFAMVCPK